MLNFSVPQLTSDGKNYAQTVFENIVKERYIISKQTNTSYADTANISASERKLLIKLIIDDLKKQRDMIEQSKQKVK